MFLTYNITSQPAEGSDKTLQSLKFEKSPGGAVHLQREPWPLHCASPPEQAFLQFGDRVSGSGSGLRI